MFFSKSTGGFYRKDIHEGLIPADAVEITDDEYKHLLSEASLGKEIVADENGRPHAVEPKNEAERQQKKISEEARAYLARTDWYVVRQQEIGKAVPEEILIGRASARERVVD